MSALQTLVEVAVPRDFEHQVAVAVWARLQHQHIAPPFACGVVKSCDTLAAFAAPQMLRALEHTLITRPPRRVSLSSRFTLERVPYRCQDARVRAILAVPVPVTLA